MVARVWGACTMLLATSKSSAAAAAAPQPQELPTTLMLSVGEEDTALRKEARCLGDGVAKKPAALCVWL